MLSAKLELRQSQSLTITPQLQQAIKLLQLSNLELQTFLEREIEQNPLIEWDERTADEASGAGKTDADEAANTANETLSGGENGAASHSETADSSDDVDLPPPAIHEMLSLRTLSGRPADGDASPESYAAQEISLRDHLHGQLHVAVTCPSRRLIGDHLIDLIDEAGYLRGTCEEVAQRLGAPLAWAEEVLGIIQGFDPAGIGARTLAECLAIQLRERNRYDPAIARLLDHLDLLAARDFGRLRRICEVDDQDIHDMAAEVRALNPKPGLQFGGNTIGAVVPDILVARDASGVWQVQLNAETLPRISVNYGFYTSARNKAHTPADRSYLQNCMNTANWLARSLDQRRRTMLKVAREIVRQQEGFLVHGVRGLRPLSLRDIAGRVGMHESTISRVTSNKYVQTPRGTFELKYFFTPAIQATGSGDAHSSEAVKDRIRVLIAGESPRHVLSDDTLVTILRAEGIDIARRTVAKYRESLRIPSSVQRRREKNTTYAKVAE